MVQFNEDLVHALKAYHALQESSSESGHVQLRLIENKENEIVKCRRDEIRTMQDRIDHDIQTFSKSLFVLEDF